jgi:hypothetical protein
MRSQIVNLCELKSRAQQDINFHYEAGSIETLKKMIEMQHGITILPQLGEKRILDALQREILLAVPQDMQHKGSRTVVES